MHPSSDAAPSIESIHQKMQISTHPCVFLLGLHGAGKTTLGRHLQSHHGWLHVSLGDLGRLARSRRLPKEFGVRLMGALAAQPPGERLSASLITALLNELERHRSAQPVSVDGFPTEPYQLSMLPSGSHLVNLQLDEATRSSRLDHRSATTVRQWSAQAALAPRDRDLPLLLEQQETSILHLDASQSVERLAQLVLDHIRS